MLSQLGSIMFLQANNLLYDDRSLFSLGVHVTEAQPRCVHHFPWAFCFENHQIMQAVPLSQTHCNTFSVLAALLTAVGITFSCCTTIVQK